MAYTIELKVKKDKKTVLDAEFKGGNGCCINKNTLKKDVLEDFRYEEDMTSGTVKNSTVKNLFGLLQSLAADDDNDCLLTESTKDIFNNL